VLGTMYNKVSQKYRFGIDLDSKCRWDLLRRYFNLRNAFPNETIVVYETKKGYHIVLPYVKTDLELRRIFGDDPARIDYEEERSTKHSRIPQDILFHTKRIIKRDKVLGLKVISGHIRDIINIMSEQFWSS
jgi:hypothetical protein